MSNKQTKNTKKNTAPKNLTWAKIKREANKVNKMEVYELNSNDSIKFYPIFSMEKVEELIEEYQKDMFYAQENKINLDNDDKFTFNYIHFLCVKYFTSLEKGVAQKLEDKILQLKHLKMNGYLDQIVEEVFAPFELQKVYDGFSKIIAHNQLFDKMNHRASEYMGQLEFKYQQILDQMDLDDKLKSLENTQSKVESEIKKKQSELNTLKQ